jgi:hypothetical protein
MEQAESLIAEIAMFTGMRQGEAFPHVHVRHGSWIRTLESCLVPKRRKGGKPTSSYPDRKSPGGEGHAREDSNL